MTRFGPKLEPGERILLRDPALRDLWAAVLTAVSVTAFVTLFSLPGRVVDGWPFALIGLLLLMFLGGSFGLTIVMAILSRAVKDGWMITDRRVIAWRGMLCRRAQEMRRADT